MSRYLFLIVALFAQLCLSQSFNSNDTLTWTPCYTGFECSDFSVPLDYANPEAGQARLAVIRYPAAQTPRLGTLFVNPGGPGVSAIDWLRLEGGRIMTQQLGLQWDIVSWDPRGVGSSEPILKWFQSEAEEADFWHSITSPGTFQAHGNLTNEADIQFFMSQAPIMDERLSAFNSLSLERNGANLTYVGTTAGVRDLVALTDAIVGVGEPVNFYGYSYGTLMAMYLSQMFPERVGKIVADGVVDPVDISLYPQHLGWDLDIADAEAVWDGFITACARAPSGQCRFRQPGETKFEIDARINQLIDGHYSRWNDTRQYSAKGLTQYMLGHMYSPIHWHYLSEWLYRRWRAFLKGGPDDDLLLTKAPSQVQISPLAPIRRVKPFRLSDGSIYGAEPRLASWGSRRAEEPYDSGNTLMDYSLVAIACSDAADSINATTTNVFREMVRVSQTVSRKWGAIFSPRFFCHAWTSRATERYNGPFNKSTANTLLVIGNEADPITPYRSAKLIASGEYLNESARLVQRWDFGHTSGSEYSICIDELLRSYFTNNTLPDSLQNDDPDTICATNQGILGLSSTLHFDPVTSENGDALTSGPNDPGLEDLLNNFTNSALIQHTGARGVLLMVLAAISGLLLHM